MHDTKLDQLDKVRMEVKASITKAKPVPSHKASTAWLGNVAGQGAVLDAGVHASRIGVTWSHLPLFLPCTVTHMCHDMTSLAILTGRLGAKTFCLPLAGIACHGLMAQERVF